MGLWKRLWISLVCLSSLTTIGCQPDQKKQQTTGFVEARLFWVVSPVAGELQRLYVTEGQAVIKGQLLAKVENQQSLIAPDDAQVAEVFYHQHEFIQPGASILSLLIPAKLHIVFFVPAMDLPKLKIGQQIFIGVANKHYPAKIVYIAPQAEYTPDSLFLEKQRDKTVVKVKARVSGFLQAVVKAGQTVDVNYE